MRLPRPHASSTRPRVLAALLGGALVLGPLALPGTAAAPYSLTIGTPTDPGPGRLSVEVTTDAPYVRATLAPFEGSEAQLAPQVVAVPSGGVVTLDLATWGLPNPASLVVAPCASNSDVDCATAQRAAASVPVSDVTPSVTWPTDTAVGQDDPPFSVTVDDPEGGGRLDVAYLGGGAFVGGQEIARDGATTLDLPDGRYTVQVRRCDALRRVCTAFPGLSRDVVVRRRALQGWIGQIFDEVRATELPVSLVVRDVEGPVDAELRVRDAAGRLMTGIDGVRPGLPLVGGVARTTIDLSSLTSGRYTIEASVTYQDPEVGPVQGFLTPTQVWVDSMPPHVSARVSRTSLYPARDGYRDGIRITATLSASDLNARVRHEVVDQRGRVLRTFEGSRTGVYYGGTTNTGRTLPAGRYMLRTVATDRAGNTARARSLTFSVSAKRLRRHTLLRTVTAAGSLIGRRVGRCSQLKLGSVRGWHGGMSLRTGTRCTGSSADNFVSTGHGLTAPPAFHYETLQISVLGGAARSEPRSGAYLVYRVRRGGFNNSLFLDPRLGLHLGTTASAPPHVFDDGFIGWSVYTGGGAQYDVKGFTVRLVYTRLE